MNKLIFTTFFCAIAFIGHAQQEGFTSPYTYGESFENRQYKEKFAGDIDGSPLLFEAWQQGEVILQNGEKYLVEKINYVVSAQKFLYMHHDTTFEFGDNVQQIIVHDNSNPEKSSTTMVFRKDIDPETDNYAQLLDSGKVTIFQEYDKKPQGENYSNGIVNNSRKYVLHVTQFALINKKAIPIKFNSASLEELTADKKKEVETYIKENNLKVKKEDDFLKAINYYNSLSS